MSRSTLQQWPIQTVAHYCFLMLLANKLLYKKKYHNGGYYKNYQGRDILCDHITAVLIISTTALPPLQYSWIVPQYISLFIFDCYNEIFTTHSTTGLNKMLYPDVLGLQRSDILQQARSMISKSFCGTVIWEDHHIRLASSTPHLMKATTTISSLQFSDRKLQLTKTQISNN